MSLSCPHPLSPFGGPTTKLLPPRLSGPVPPSHPQACHLMPGSRHLHVNQHDGHLVFTAQGMSRSDSVRLSGKKEGHRSEDWGAFHEQVTIEMSLERQEELFRQRKLGWGGRQSDDRDRQREQVSQGPKFGKGMACSKSYEAAGLAGAEEQNGTRFLFRTMRSRGRAWSGLNF